MSLTLDYSRKIPWTELPRVLRFDLVDYGRPDLRGRIFLVPHPELDADAWSSVSSAALKAGSDALEGLARPDASGHGAWMEFTEAARLYAWMEFTEAARLCSSHTFHFLPVPDGLDADALAARRRDDFAFGFARTRSAVESVVDLFPGQVRTLFEESVESPSPQAFRSRGFSVDDEAAALAMARLDELFLIEAAVEPATKRPRKSL